MAPRSRHLRLPSPGQRSHGPAPVNWSDTSPSGHTCCANPEPITLAADNFQQIRTLTPLAPGRRPINSWGGCRRPRNVVPERGHFAIFTPQQFLQGSCRVRILLPGWWQVSNQPVDSHEHCGAPWFGVPPTVRLARRSSLSKINSDALPATSEDASMMRRPIWPLLIASKVSGPHSPASGDSPPIQRHLAAAAGSAGRYRRRWSRVDAPAE